MKPIGPYSPYIKIGNLIFTSGQLPVNPQTGSLENDDIESQTRQALNNLLDVIRESGAKPENIVKLNLYLADMEHFARVNDIYQNFFSPVYPARTCVQVSRLPKDALVEVDAIAVTFK